MPKILVIPDVHQKLDLLINALKAESTVDHTVFLGDYFDDFDDNIYEVQYMASWLKENLYINSSKRTFLLGNHDFQYMLSRGTNIYCSGYAGWKHEAIENILTKEDWSKFEYFYSYDNYWLSHAGITNYWFAHPIHGIDANQIKETLNKMKRNVEAEICDYGPVWSADQYRGGRHQKGGILWNDMRNSEMFENVTQVIGHTPVREPLIKTDETINSKNVFIDTHLNYYCIINTEDGSIDFIKNEYEC